MGRLYELAVVYLLITALLHSDSTWAKKGSGSSSKPSSSNRGGSSSSKPSRTTHTQAGNYPRQPQKPNPYPAGGSYPGRGTNTGGSPNQNPGAGSYPGRTNQGIPNQNPAGSYPGGGSYPGRTNQGGNPNQNPAGGYPAAGRNPAAGGYPNQYPGRANPGGFPQNPGGGYPGAGGYPNQYPGRGGYANQYPGGYPVRGGNTGQGFGQPGGYPGGYPGGGGGYTNWNPNNQILSPRYGGGGYGQGGYGMGGSPFSRSVQSMGHSPSVSSQGFAKKAMMAAGVGAVAGMAIGYGLGRFPRPHFNFRNPEEEHYYNNYMYNRYGTQSTDQNDFGRDYAYKPPPRAKSYDTFMGECMNGTDIRKEQAEDDDDTVSIEEIGYPALVEQQKSRRCVERYMEYSARFLQKETAEQRSAGSQPSRSDPLSQHLVQLLTTGFMLLSSTLLLH